MADDFLNYYKSYHEKYGERGYGASKVLHTSRMQIIKELVEQFTNPGHDLLDVGSGDCGLASLVPNVNYTGIDCNPNLSNGRAIYCDLDSGTFPFPDESFDVVVCSEVLEHLFDLRKVHREVYRLLRPNGIYIVSTPNFNHIDHFFTQFSELITDFNQSHLIEHVRFFTPETHTKFLNSSGFEVLTTFGADAHFSKVLQEPRKRLVEIMDNSFDIKMSVWDADKILGWMFKDISHTIGLVGRKVSNVKNTVDSGIVL